MVAVVATVGGQAAADEMPLPEDSTPILRAIAAANMERMKRLPKLQFRASSRYEFGEKFLELNPEYVPVHGTSDVLEGYLATNRYSMAVLFPRLQNATTPVVTVAYDGVTYRSLAHEALVVSKKFVLQPGGAMPLGTALLLPFAFLFPTDPPNTLPLIVPEMVVNPETWTKAFKGAKVVAIVRENGDTTTTVRLPQADGGFVNVLFTGAEKYRPTRIEKFNRRGHLNLRYQTIATTEVAGISGFFLVPNEMLVDFEHEGFHQCRYVVHVESIDVVRDLEPSVFTLDAARATTIYDLDTKVLTAVPK